MAGVCDALGDSRGTGTVSVAPDGTFKPNYKFVVAAGGGGSGGGGAGASAAVAAAALRTTTGFEEAKDEADAAAAGGGGLEGEDDAVSEGRVRFALSKSDRVAKSEHRAKCVRARMAFL